VAILAPAWSLGAACLAGAALAQGGRSNPRLDLLTHFAPVWMLGALLTALAGLFVARGAGRLALVGLGALGVLAAGLLLAPELTRPIRPAVSPDPTRQIRLIQFNVWDQNLDPERTADWISGQAPEVVTLEEAPPGLALALAARGFRMTRGMGSTAIYSRGLAAAPRLRLPSTDWPTVPEFGRASFVGPGGRGTFSVLVVHLTWPTVARFWGQPAALAALLGRQPRDRLIIAGDFNLTPWSFGLRRLDRRFGLERRDRAIPTWPARRRVAGRIVRLPAFLAIDHVYAGAAWRTVRIRRGPALGSDHYPLVVDLALEG
jgi:endonuclease/exonuclease/phosphatase (EEP) superfamily protein YafD